MKIKTPGITFNCEVEGNKRGPTVVFSNSLGSDLSMWQPQAAALKADYRVVRYDTRGHGGSDVTDAAFTFARFVDDALALLDALELERVHFVGLSMGGMTALGLALQHPDRLHSITAANCIAQMPAATHATWDERARTAREQGMAALVQGSLERWFTAPGIASGRIDVHAVSEMIKRTPPAGYAAACAALKTLDYLGELGRITVPTLFIAGTHDQGTPLAAMQDMQRRVRGARLVELDAAHVSNLEQPEAFTAALRDFLEAQR